MEDIEEDALPPVRVVVELPPQMTAPIAPQSEKGSSITALDIVAWVWAVGGLSFLSVHIVSYLRYRRRVTVDGRIVDNIDLLNEITELKRSLHIDRTVTVMEYPQAGSPMMMGFIKPILVLPRENYTAEELYFILKHELVHLKRGDVYFKLLFVAANALHWFNPLVWILQKEASVDMELSCDERVTKGASIDARKAYTEVLMSTIHKQFYKRNVLSTQFYGGKKIMKKRFSNILTKKAKKSGISILICAIALVLYLGTVTMVGCTTGNKPSDADSLDDFSGMSAEEIANKVLSDLQGNHEKIIKLIYNGDILSDSTPVDVDGIPYYPVGNDIKNQDDARELLQTAFTEELTSSVMYSYFLAGGEHSIFKEIDGKLYKMDAYPPDETFELPVLSARWTGDNVIVAAVEIDPQSDYRFDITLVKQDNRWRINQFADVEKTAGSPTSDATATAKDTANKALADLENDYNIAVAILTMNMTEPVNLVEGVDQLGNLREIDGVSYIPMKEDYDTIDEIMEVFHRVYTEKKCAELYTNYLDDTGFMKEVDGKLYCMGGGKGHTAFNMPIESAEKISETEILAKTSATFEYGDVQYEITLNYEDGKWKIGKLTVDGREYSY